MSWEDAEYYEVRNVWVVLKEMGEDVVIEVQGVRGDGSYWVSGFNLTIPKQTFDRMSISEIDKAIVDAIRKNEEETRKWRYLQVESDRKTQLVRGDPKVKWLLGRRYFRQEFEGER